MKLIMAEASPFARKVRVVLRETNQLKDVEEVITPLPPDRPVRIEGHGRPLGCNEVEQRGVGIRRPSPGHGDGTTFGGHDFDFLRRARRCSTCGADS